jgi:hypothetical protein
MAAQHSRPTTQVSLEMVVWKTVRLPLRIFFTGLSVILLFSVWRRFGLPGPGVLLAALSVDKANSEIPGFNASATLAALFVMTTGVMVVAMLWWMIDRYFGLIQKGAVSADFSNMRDLPLGLPEGTIRAILALLVAVVGRPILIFSKTLALDTAIAGYVNEISNGGIGLYPLAQTAKTLHKVDQRRLIHSSG